ncbi:MAG: 2-C-methyl-D-erythritol 2,4-cyclodiphosphate synthase, partial [Candidatus Contubernalis sp.]|nr:2-C-methyl-D-erythritol 2,4-cyclodiphosphate synthase [Candidatus Contubernalis sp.]
AVGKGDIGRHFPDTQEQYRGISSRILLARVNHILEEEGYQVVNVDTVIIAQRPKLSPYIEEMTQNIASTLGVEEKAVNVKATTTEGLGFPGREEGIAAQAIAMLSKGFTKLKK